MQCKVDGCNETATRWAIYCQSHGADFMDAEYMASACTCDFCKEGRARVIARAARKGVA